MAKSKTDAQAEGFKRGLKGKDGTAGLMQGWRDDAAAGAARTQGYIEGKRQRSRDEAAKRAKRTK